jgi:hypothetical protein
VENVEMFENIAGQRFGRRLSVFIAAIAGAAVTLLVVGISGPVRPAAANMPVFDAASVAQLVQQVASMSQQLSTAKDHLSVGTQAVTAATSLNKTFGLGVPASSLTGSNSLLNVASGGSSILGTSQTGVVSPDLKSALGGATSIGGTTASSVSSATSAAALVQKSLGTSAGSSTSLGDQRGFTAARASAKTAGFQDALAASLWSSDDAAKSVPNVKKMADAAAAAAAPDPDGDLRKQISVLTTVALANYEEQLKLRTLLAAQARMQATEGIASDRQTYLPNNTLPTTGGQTSSDSVFGTPGTTP